MEWETRCVFSTSAFQSDALSLCEAYISQRYPHWNMWGTSWAPTQRRCRPYQGRRQFITSSQSVTLDLSISLAADSSSLTIKLTTPPSWYRLMLTTLHPDTDRSRQSTGWRSYYATRLWSHPIGVPSPPTAEISSAEKVLRDASKISARKPVATPHCRTLPIRSDIGIKSFWRWRMRSEHITTIILIIIDIILRIEASSMMEDWYCEACSVL